ncbi:MULTISPECIES: ATP-dependent endonuclease [Vibrio]|uniref:ATP-dependent endonuclease n=1 Tax=Vibrio atlanticus TaxID=693153 RepID=A0ABV4KWD9_9VIBR
MMDFKQAKFNDYWRTSAKRNYDVYVNKFEVNEGTILTGANLILNKGINAIAGKNGVGKSTIISSLYNSIKNENSNRCEISTLLDSDHMSITLKLKKETGGTHDDVCATVIESSDVTAYLFDPCSYIPKYLDFVREEDNLDEQLEQVAAISYDSNKLENINYLTNSNYQRVTVWNIEGEYDAHPLLPFFEVESNGITYTSKNMGLGEIALIYFFWMMERIANINEKAIILMEEPESYLPPKTQKRLMNCVSWLASEQGVCVLISTHSEHVLSFLDDDKIQLIIDCGHEKKFIHGIEAVDTVLELGLQKVTTKLGLLSVEDEFALALLKSILGARVESYSFEVAGSEGDLLKRCEIFQPDVDGYSYRAIFDGDTRGKYQKQLSDSKVARYLPLNDAPDKLILDFFKTLTVQEIAEILSLAEHRVVIAKGAAEGVEFHDYFREFSKSLPIEEGAIIDLFAGRWCEANSDLVSEFLEQL